MGTLYTIMIIILTVIITIGTDRPYTQKQLALRVYDICDMNIYILLFLIINNCMGFVCVLSIFTLYQINPLPGH